MAWIIKNQFGRRNLPDYVRVKLALRLEAEIAARAKAKYKDTVGRPSESAQKSAEIKSQPIETRREVAAIAHVSHDTVAKVKKIEVTAAFRLLLGRRYNRAKKRQGTNNQYVQANEKDQNDTFHSTPAPESTADTLGKQFAAQPKPSRLSRRRRRRRSTRHSACGTDTACFVKTN